VCVVKNGFSNPTKAKVGQDGKDVMNEHQGKALKEAVVKEMGSDECNLQERRITPKGI